MSKEEKYRYRDQDFVELYDWYDLESNEKVPQMLQDAPIVGERNNQRTVKIDYPLVEGTFRLNGKVALTAMIEEAGKKAFVRGGYYKHPTKSWQAEIVFMTPNEYIENCVKIFKRRGSERTKEEVIEMRRLDYNIKEVFDKLKGDLSYLLLDYKGLSQEGLHRAIYAMDEELQVVPVVVIKNK